MPKVVLCPLGRIASSGDRLTVQMTREDVKQMPDFGYNVSAGGG